MSDKINNIYIVPNHKCVQNTRVYGLKDSIVRAKYPMAVETDLLNSELTHGIASLAQSKPGSGHDQWLTGINVQFDLKFSIKAWTEAERYHFLDFVSSQSTMHRIQKMDIKNCCNKYVTPVIIEEVKRLQDAYNKAPSDNREEEFLTLVYNIPAGFELTAGMITNYRQLKTIYAQRKTHRLPEWRDFCNWIESLPYSELLTGVES